MDDMISRQEIEWHDYLVADGNGMYRNEKVAYKSQVDMLPSAEPETNGMKGWICPVCGRGLSPLTSVCPCNNGKGWEATC